MASLKERIALYATLTALTSLSIDALLPGLHDMSHDLAFGSAVAIPYVISLFVLGMAIGELFMGPISDAIGRKKALQVGLLVYVFGTMIAATAVSWEVVIIGRVVQGVGVAGPKIATRAMIRDQFQGDEMAHVMSLMFTLFILVPMLGPLLAQGLVDLTGWRGIFFAYLVLAAVSAAWLTTRQPETLAQHDRVPLRPSTVFRNSRSVLSQRRVAMLIIATGLVFGSQLHFLSNAVGLFSSAYSIGDAFPLWFALLASGIGIASFLNGRCVRQFGMIAMARFGFALLTVSGALMAAVAMGTRPPPFQVFMALAFISFLAIGVLFGNLNAIAMATLGRVAGLGSSLVASGSSLIATGFALLLSTVFEGGVFGIAMGFFFGGALAITFAELGLKSTDNDLE